MQDLPEQRQLSPRSIAESDTLRSQIMKRLIRDGTSPSAATTATVPRVVVQYWNDLSAIPEDVQQCIDSWAETGLEHQLFDDRSAEALIGQDLGPRYASAFARCEHPAMRADYFRLCYLRLRGGLYVDADDVFLNVPIEHLLSDGLLKVQPLCYDVSTDSMLNPAEAAQAEDDVDHPRIFYVNNNPLVAPAGHPLIDAALERATDQLLIAQSVRDIQSLTGPGNLTAVLVEHAVDTARKGEPRDFVVMSDWSEIARIEWALEYRADHRNWRQWAHSEVER